MKCENCNKLLDKIRRVQAKVGLLALNHIEKQTTVDRKTMDTMKYIVDEFNTDDLNKET